MASTTQSTTVRSTNPPINQAVNPANAPVHDTRIAHHSHEKAIDNSITNQSNNSTTSGHLDTHDKTEKGGLIHNLLHGSSDKHAADKHASDKKMSKHDKHHNKSLTSSNDSTTNKSITNNHIMDAGINSVRNRHSNTGVLANSLANYSNQLAALNQTRQRIAAAFAAVLSEQNSPYTQLAQEYSQAELSLVHNQATIPDRMVDQTYQDFDRRQGRINELADTLNKQRSSVEHYSDKLAKLFHDRDTAVSSGKTLSTKELERLERNQVKARDAELAYNTTNSQLIEEINHLGTAPVQQLGPAMISFISGEQMRAAQTNAALSKIIIDANTINSRADMWARSQPHTVAPNTGASRIHGLTTDVRDRSASGWTASSTASAASAPLSTTDAHRHSTSHSTSHTDKHHDKHHDKTHDKDASHNKDVRAMTDAMGTTMIRSEEQLAIGLERVVTEQVRMHKYVTSEIINVPITLRKEHISIERVHIHDKDRRNSHSTTNHSTSGHHSVLPGHHSDKHDAKHDAKHDTTLNRSGAIAPTGAAANTYATSSTTGTNTLASTNSGVTAVPTTGLHGQTATTSNTGLYGTNSNNMTGTGLQGSSLSAASNSILYNDVAGEWDFVLSAEQPVITTRVVPYERVRVRKYADRSVQRISADLAKENVDFTLTPNLENQGQPEVAIRDVDPALHQAHGKGQVVECMDGNGLVNQAGSGAQLAQTGGLYNKDQSALQTGTTSTYDKTQSNQLTNQQRAINDGRPVERV